MPERVIIFNGEMEGDENRRRISDWMGSIYVWWREPITTKTWWGGLVSGATEVVSTIALTGGAGKIMKGASLATHFKTVSMVCDWF